MNKFIKNFLVSLTAAVALFSTGTFAQKMDLGTQARYGSTAWTPTLATVPGLTATGNTILGSSIANSMVLNAGTWTLGTSVSATQAAGTLAAGTVNVLTLNQTFTGDAGGTTAIRGLLHTPTTQGANAISTSNGYRIDLTHAGSATLATGRGMQVTATLSSSGNVTTLDLLNLASPTLSSTGAITTLNGLHVGAFNSALIATAIGVKVDNFTNATVAMRGIQSSLSSGTGKFNIYADGTADNAFAGNVRIGSTTAPTVALHVTGAALISTTLGVTGIQSNSNKIYPGTDAAAAQTAAGIYAGTGAPNNANGADGDFYLRSDGGALTTIYQRRAGAWVGII